MKFSISEGAIYTPAKCVIYGPEGIGKTILASKFPDPVFIDTEESSKGYGIRRICRPDGGITPTSWTMLLEMVSAVRDGHISAKTLVIDSLDWAETLCIKHIADKYHKEGIEDFGYGKGYTYVEEEFGHLLNQLSEVISKGIHVVCTAHATMKRIELPEETGAYDHWEMKLEKKDAALVKEWADMVLFCTYKTIVIAGKTPMEKNKAAGGKRIMYATHTPWWDAKNRFGLPDELPMDYNSIGHIFSIIDSEIRAETEIDKASPVPSVVKNTEHAGPHSPEDSPQFSEIDDTDDIPDTFPEQSPLSPDIPKALRDIMEAENVTEAQLQKAVAKRGYYPEDTPISNYDPQFVYGCLVACWDQVKTLID